jgi:hypothetical protein
MQHICCIYEPGTCRSAGQVLPKFAASWMLEQGKKVLDLCC